MNEKRILVISQVIPQWYVDLLTSSLGEDAHIDIITSSDVYGNIIHSPEYDPHSFKSRLLSWYKHYCFMTKWLRENKRKNYDLIFSVSNPPINSAIGLKLKKCFHAPFIYMNWDLYPQVIRTAIHNPIVKMFCSVWSAWNSRNFPKIDQLLTIGDVMADSMNDDIKNKVSVEVIPIGVDTERLKPIEKSENPFCGQNNLVDKFVVLYSGKMGLGHNIEMILEASEVLKDKAEIVFVFIGFGPKFDVVQKFIERNHPENIRLYQLQSEEMFPYSMACGDIGIVTQEVSMAHLFLPSKVYSMMACGEAIVGIGTDHDDLYKLINSEKVGVGVTNDSAKKLVEVVLDLYNQKETALKYKEKSRQVVVEKYDLSVVKDKYSALFRVYL